MNLQWLNKSIIADIDDSIDIRPILNELTAYFNKFESTRGVEPDVIVRKCPQLNPPDGFGLDTPSTPFRLYFGEEGRAQSGSDTLTIVHQPHRGRSYLISPDRVEYLLEAETLEDQLSIVRLLRERLVQKVLFAGGAKVHAAAVQVLGSGLLLIGPSGCGKTTLLLRILEHKGAALVGGDRVVVIDTDDGLAAAGSPIALQIGADLASDIPTLADYHQPAAHVTLPKSFRPEGNPFRKISMRPIELVKALGRELIPTSTLDFVIVPAIGDQSATSFSIELLQFHERQQLLAKEILNNDPAFPAAVSGSTETTPPPDLISGLLNLPWLKVSGDFRDASLATHLISAIDRRKGSVNV
uniref:HPr kinase/phosphorylase C-terminal domain-containing protein n=1 Tax=Agrobacterium tumefaciens TaxID=358 RepID=A0A2Z2PR11_AGRTU|nr:MULTISPECIES: hypothetical protein [Agrobacterium tumefaciens complex]ASK45103.1 hypothetical protein [Agrobacterium radiobacter]